MAIKTLVFDIDNTMYDYTRGDRAAKKVVAEYCRRELDLPLEQFEERYRNADKVLSGRIGYPCASVHNRLIRFQCMMEDLGKPLFPHAKNLCHLYWDTLMTESKPEPGLLDFLEFSRKKGLKIGVGTNMTAYMQYRKMERLGLERMIDWMVTSEECGKEKPQPELFLLCVEKSGCRAQECLFIGDSLKGDILGAERCGMKTAWYTALLDQPPEYSGDGIRIGSYKDCCNDEFFRMLVPSGANT